MPVLKANHRHVLAAKPIDGKRTRYRIEGVPGLWLYFRPNGVRTWYARYDVKSGQSRKQSWFRIGDGTSIGLSQAISLAKEVGAQVVAGKGDPLAKREDDRKQVFDFGKSLQPAAGKVCTAEFGAGRHGGDHMPRSY